MDEKTLKDLRDQHRKALDEADAITALAETENRGLSPDENDQVQAFLKEAKLWSLAHTLNHPLGAPPKSAKRGPEGPQLTKNAA